ncbi:MAG: FtsX-like permease family protein [Oscillospiraceae bacterium]
MKKTYRKLVRRTIWNTFSRFLAIFAIVALGVGFLAGLLAATPDMRYSGDKYFDETNLADLRVISTLGLTDADAKAIGETEGIDEVMPSYTADLLMHTSGGENVVARVHSMPFSEIAKENPKNYLNRFVLAEGRMPQNKTECVVERSPINGIAINLGDTLTATAENKDLDKTLSQTKFTVVGVVESSYYFSFERETAHVGNGQINVVAYFANDSFAMEQYSEIYATIKDAKALNSLSSKYTQVKDSLVASLEDIAPERNEIRLEEVKIKANETLADARNEYNEEKADAEKKLADAAKEIQDGEEEIADAKTELADAAKKIQDGEAELLKQRKDFVWTIEQSQNEIDSGTQKLKDAKAQVEDNEKLYAQTAAQLAQSEAQLAQLTAARQAADALYAQNPTPENAAAAQYLKQQEEDALAQLAGGKAQLSAFRAQLDGAKAEIDANISNLDNAQVQLSNGLAAGNYALDDAEQKLVDGRRELAKGKKELADAEIEIADGKKEYTDKKAEADEKLADADKKIKDAQKDIDALELPEWYVLGRESITSFSSFDSNISKVEAIARVFPIFFFLVAALVALTTMTRMVEEERLQIGTLKALGYSKGTIAFKYSLYAFLASAFGSLAGLLIGFNLFPRVIWNAYSMMYNLPPLTCQFNVKYAVLASCIAIACTMLATANACWSSLHETPARLMLPRTPKAGKRILLEHIPFIWKRMKFTHKVTARNLFLYKKRFFMTVIGIAGCTALLVTGFGLRDSISDIIGKQFSEIFKYNLVISAKDEAAVNSPELQKILTNQNEIASSLAVHQEKSTNNYGGVSTSVYIVVPEDLNRLDGFVSLHERRGNKQPVPLGEKGVVLSEKLAARADVEVGDEITVANNDKENAQFTVTGIAENYVENYVYMSAMEYERGYGAKPDFTLLYANTAQSGAEEQSVLAEQLLLCEDINNISFVSDLRRSFDDMLKNITYVVYVLIASAAVLAFVVLYNLTNININERQKEIATIKVLGFFDREVSAYVYRESVMLSIIGTALGLVLGVFLHMFVIRTAEVDVVMFGREIKVISFVISAALTLLFSAIVNLVMNKKLRNISMVESMKAPE